MTYSLATTKTVEVAGVARKTVERYQSMGTKGRIEIDRPGMPPIAAGSYFIVNLADTTLTMVLPGMKMAMIQVLPPPMVTTGIALSTISQITKGEVTDLGAGDTIAGRPTHRYRITREAKLTTTGGDKTCTETVGGTDDTWISADDGLKSTLASATSSFARLTAFGPPSTASWVHLFDEKASNIPKGVRLRTVHADTVADADGVRAERTTTVEIGEIAATAIDSSAFAIPAGYRIMDLRTSKVDGRTFAEIFAKTEIADPRTCK